MHCDRYGLRLTTGSALACERYVRGCELLLTLYPGAAAAFDEAIAADPRFALAHVAKARVLQLHGDVAGARAALEVGRGLLDEATAREASHFDAFDRIINSPGPVALEAVLEHVRAWPLDALVLGTCASQFGLIGLSGLAGREQRLADLLDTVAGAYGEDWWFLAHHGMALSEVGRRAEARQKIGRSRAMRAENGFMAHAQAHVSYEDGEADEAAAFMRAWLPGYPREGALFGHLSWHLALVELERGEVAAAFGRYSDAIAAADYPGSRSSSWRTRRRSCGERSWRDIRGMPGNGRRWWGSRGGRSRGRGWRSRIGMWRWSMRWRRTTRRWLGGRGRWRHWRRRAGIRRGRWCRRWRSGWRRMSGRISRRRSG